MSNCIFCKIINRQIPSEIVYEDDHIISFKDIDPAAPIHLLVIPKKHIEKVTDLKMEDEGLIGRIYATINKIAEEQGFAKDGFRIIVNCRRTWWTRGKSYTFSYIRWKGTRRKNCRMSQNYVDNCCLFMV